MCRNINLEISPSSFWCNFCKMLKSIFAKRSKTSLCEGSSWYTDIKRLASTLDKPFQIGCLKACLTCAARKLLDPDKDIVKDLRWVVVKVSASSSIGSPCPLKWAASYKLSIPLTSPVRSSLNFPSSFVNFRNKSN